MQHPSTPCTPTALSPRALDAENLSILLIHALEKYLKQSRGDDGVVDGNGSKGLSKHRGLASSFGTRFDATRESRGKKRDTDALLSLTMFCFFGFALARSTT